MMRMGKRSAFNDDMRFGKRGKKFTILAIHRRSEIIRGNESGRFWIKICQ